ncbi:hypothetical protein D3C86_1947750 [compost metagenome]
MARRQTSRFLHQAADRRNLHAQLACFFIFIDSNQTCLQQIEIHWLQQALRCFVRFARIVSVIIKRHFYTVSYDSIHCQLEEMMAVFGVEILAAQTVNPADYLGSCVPVSE